jgi:hypothetical protein
MVLQEESHYIAVTVPTGHEDRRTFELVAFVKVKSWDIIYKLLNNSEIAFRRCKN